MPLDLPPIEFLFYQSTSVNTFSISRAQEKAEQTYAVINDKKADTDFIKNIADSIKKIIVDKLGVDEKEVTVDASFTNDLGADSLDTIELVMEFESKFNISIPDEDAEKIVTVGDAIMYIQQKVKTIQ